MAKTSGYRWVVLAIYAWVAGLSQLLWLNFAPILSFVEKHYGVTETTASLLLLIFPLTYVLLSVHAGRVIDAKGYRYAIGVGALLMAVFSCLRIVTGNFWIMLAAQTGISLGQPYVVNGITKLVLDWFPAEQAVLATGLGTVGLLAGMAIGLAVTPPLFEAYGFTSTMAIFAALTCVSTVAFFALCRTRSGQPKLGQPSSFLADAARQFQNRNLVLLFVVSFLGLGYFNGLTSWIEAILAPNGINSTQAGAIGGIMIIGGILGSIAIPALSDWLKRRKPFLLLSTCAGAVLLVPLCRSHAYGPLLAWSFFQGFFFLPAYALLLDMTALEAGEKHAGSATGMMMMTGNAGAVIVIAFMGYLKDGSPDFSIALGFLLGLLALATGSIALLREPVTS